MDESRNDDSKVVPGSHSNDTPPDYEALAREQGWRPKEQFKGAPENFVDAKTFYERGLIVWPLLKAENQALRAEIDRVRVDAQRALQVSEQSREREVAELKIELQQARLARKEAVKEGDGDNFEAAEARIKELESAIQASQPIKPSGPPQTDPQFQSWLNSPEQTWFRDDEEAQAMAEGMVKLSRYKHLYNQREKLWDAVAADVKKMRSPKDESLDRPGPQGAGRGNGEVRTEAGKRAYNNLKPEMQRQCERQFKEFNPAGTLDSWKERYVKSVSDDAFRK